jgi:prophage regulatory protein
MNERILRRPEVERRTGLSRSCLYDWVRRGEFPRPVALGTRMVGWRESDIEAWMAARETKGAGGRHGQT